MAKSAGFKMSSIPTKGSVIKPRMQRIKPSLGQRDYGKQTAVGANPMMASPITGAVAGMPAPKPPKGGI